MAAETEDAGHPDFERELENVERIVELLERGDLPLEEAILKYESGSRSLRRCYRVLETARKRIEVLAMSSTSPPGDPSAAGAGAGPEWRPMEPIESNQEEHGPGDT